MNEMNLEHYTMGDLVNCMISVRESKRELNEKIKTCEETFGKLKAEVIRRLEEEGTLSTKTKYGIATITKTTVANIKDWSTLWAWIKDNDADYLLQHRISNPAYRELLQSGEGVPGTESVEVVDISLRAA